MYLEDANFTWQATVIVLSYMRLQADICLIVTAYPRILRGRASGGAELEAVSVSLTYL